MEIIISFVSGAVAFILVRGIVMILGMEKKIKELQALVDSLITNVERRAGDIAKCFADPTKANKELNWSCKYNLEDMCKDSYTFQLNSISNALSID